MSPLATFLRRSARQAPTLRPPFHGCLRYSSGVKACPPTDMFMAVLNRTAWHALGASIGALAISVYKPFSRGAVSLVSKDPDRNPRICFNLLSDERDLTRMMVGTGFAIGLFDHPRLRDLCSVPFVPSGRWIQRLRSPRRVNQILAWLAARALDGPETLRQALLGGLAQSLEGLGADPEQLSAFVRRRSVPVGHVAGTCRIGRKDDPEAVVDPQGRGSWNRRAEGRRRLRDAIDRAGQHQYSDHHDRREDRPRHLGMRAAV